MARGPGRPLAALTGGTGFLGRHLAQALDEAGYRVRILTREAPDLPDWRGAPPEVVTGRLADAAALERLVQGADVVVHAAGLIKARRRQDFFEVNREGSGRLAAAAGRAPKARFVMISSLSARAPQLSAYGSSKSAGEQAVRENLDPDRFTIVRPPAIYGPGDRETLALFKAVRDLPFTPLPGGARARLAMIHVADAAAQIAVLAGRRAAGATFALSDPRPEGYGWREIMRTAGRAMGRDPVMLRLPVAAVLSVGLAGSALARLSGTTPMLTLGKARELLHLDWSVSPPERAPDLPSARFDLEAGFQDAVAWYRARGWL